MITDHRFIGRREWGLTAPADAPCQAGIGGGEICGQRQDAHGTPSRLDDAALITQVATALYHELDGQGIVLPPDRDIDCEELARAAIEAVMAAQHTLITERLAELDARVTLTPNPTTDEL